MNILKRRILFLALLTAPVAIYGQASDLAKDFRNPPKEYSLLPFWSWNGTLKPEKLIWQIDQMMDKGIYGAFMHARAGLDESETPYFSEGFWKAVDTTIKYSALKGFHPCLYDEDKWPSGSAGGRTIAANPDEFTKKVLFYNRMEVVGPQNITLNLQKKPLAVFAGRISENGIYDYSSQVNLTDKAGQQWNVPMGRWAIISFESDKDPGAQIDYLDPAAVAQFIKVTHEEYFKRFGSYFGTTIPGVFFDEIYADYSKMNGNIFWTDDFLSKFRKGKGYELTDNLPLIVFADPRESGKIRYDYFDVVKDLYIKAWFKQYADWCAEHKIWATGHTTEKLIHYIRQSDYFSTIGQLQVPGTDNEEYRYGFPRMIDWYNTKQISSIGHLYNRKRVMAESMGGGGYTIPLEEYRYGFAMLGVYGVNMFIPHLFHYTTDTPETQSDWPPSWFFQNPYWKYFKPLAEFASRIAFMNSQGKPVCDIAILYPLTDLWEGGYPARIDDSFYKEVQQELLDSHIDYDIIDPSSMAAAKIEGNTIEAGTGKYRVLVLPSIHAIRTDVLQQIVTFVTNGGTVIALNDLPVLSEKGRVSDEVVAEEVNELFGFPPASLKPQEYYQWNMGLTEHYTTKSFKSGGAAFFSRFTDQLSSIINTRIKPDIEVFGNNNRFLRFNHRMVENKDVFQLVNDRNTPEQFHISLRNIGIPSLWNPETGEIQSFDNYSVSNGRLDLFLDFKPRESYFLVLEPGNPGNSDSHLQKKWILSKLLPEIKLDGDWQFQVVPHKLDYTWSSTVDADTLILPVMRFQSERSNNEGLKWRWYLNNFADSSWKLVKINDEYSKKTGIQRYMSGWDAWWISYYDISTHLPDIEGGNRTFRKTFTLDTEAKEAKIAVTADHTYELIINGKKIGSDSDWKTTEVYDIAGNLKKGINTIILKTTQTRGMLLQGLVMLKNRKNIEIRSDNTWQVSAGEAYWQPAFLFAAPPQGSWGNIENPLQKMKFPVTVWYRQKLPLGVKSIKKPEVKGEYTLYLNGVIVNTTKNGSFIDLTNLLKQYDNEIVIGVKALDETYGLVEPLELVCGKANMPLISWDKMGLEWYSGRAMYSRKIEIPANYLQQGIQLVLDPGQVDYFAEIWINDKLVKYCPWAPYDADITGFVKPGENKITIVVANLLANKATWNILDENISNKDARWWHNGSIMREKEKLVSGLIGPGKIIAYTAESVARNVQNNLK